MNSTASMIIDVADVQLGMYIGLEVGWINHPFAMSRFKVATPAQLHTLQTCGVPQVRVDVLRSDPQAIAQWRRCARAVAEPSLPPALALVPDAAGHDEGADEGEAAAAVTPKDAYGGSAAERFVWAADCYMQLCEVAAQQPQHAAARAQALVQGYVQELLHSPHTVLRLLADGAGEHAAAHPVNVTVLSLIVGKSLGMAPDALQALGLAALLHDIGKVQLPPPCRHPQLHMSAQELQVYQSHVGASVAMAQAMGLSVQVQQYIAQHHEHEDGSGYPLGLVAEDLVQPAKVLALVNTYDQLCSPGGQTPAYTPHEAMCVLFAQRKPHFGDSLVAAFVAAMGVYPPGTVVQLSDGRYGVVDSACTRHPRKPVVRVPAGPACVRGAATEEVDLAQHHGLLIKRSLRPEQLPRQVLEVLSPQRRICYFFERAVDITTHRRVR